MRFELRLHGRKVAALKADLADLGKLTVQLTRRAHEAGKDIMAHDIGTVILDLAAKGTEDSEIIASVEDMIALRMMAGLPDAVEQLAAKDET